MHGIWGCCWRGWEQKSAQQDYMWSSCLLVPAWFPSRVLDRAPVGGSPGGLWSLLLLWSSPLGGSGWAEICTLSKTEGCPTLVFLESEAISPIEWAAGDDGSREHYIRLKPRWKKDLPVKVQNYLTVLCIVNALWKLTFFRHPKLNILPYIYGLPGSTFQKTTFHLQVHFPVV